jgi:4-hydroxybenzoate polyprenyltransferase
LEMIKIEHTLFALPFAFIGAFFAARGLRHACMVILPVIVFLRAGLGMLSLFGLGLVTLLLAHEHSLVKRGDVSRINAAFFPINGWISVPLFVVAGVDRLWHRAS